MLLGSSGKMSESITICDFSTYMTLAVVTQDWINQHVDDLDQCDHGTLGKYDMFLVLLGDVCQV